MKNIPVYTLVNYIFEGINVVFQQIVFPLVGKIGSCLPQHACHIILGSSFHTSLVVDKMYGIVVCYHDVAALKIAEHEIFILSMCEIIAQRFKIINELLLVIWFAQRVEEIIFEIKKVGHNRLFAKFFIGQALFIIEPVVAFNLQF